MLLSISDLSDKLLHEINVTAAKHKISITLQLPTVAALRAYTFGLLQTGDKNRHSVSH